MPPRLVFCLLFMLVSLRCIGAADPAIVPGTIITLDFPELGVMHEKLPAACEVGIPAGYDPANPVPLFVWLGGGSGSHLIKHAAGMVDFDRFVVVALPYPNGYFPRLAAKDGKIDDYWEFHRVMLERVKALVPNIDAHLRLVGGTSSGGHYIAYGIDRAWPGFADYFTSFIIHEGGAQPLTPGIPNAKGKHLLVVYGEKSTSISWRYWLNWNLHLGGADATYVGIPKAGHGLNDDGRKAIRDWIEEIAVLRAAE